MMPSKKVLVIDECQDILTMFQTWLSDVCGFTMHGASSANKALEICKAQPLDVILADVDSLGGLQFAARIRNVQPQARIYLMTAGLSNYTADDLLNLGVASCFSKPIQFAKLVAIFEGQPDRNIPWQDLSQDLKIVIAQEIPQQRPC